jgi:hypothetical protein
VPLIDRIRRRIGRNLAPFIGSAPTPHIIREIDARVAAKQAEQRTFPFKIYRPTQIVCTSGNGEYDAQGWGPWQSAARLSDRHAAASSRLSPEGDVRRVGDDLDRHRHS